MQERPKFLTVLCLLSGFSAAYGIVSGLSSAMSPPEVDAGFLEDMIAQLNQFELPVEGLQEDMNDYYRNLMLNMGNYGAATFLFSGIQALGVYMMYQRNRIGFALYSLSQVGAACSPVIFGGLNTFGQYALAINLIWNFVWVGLFATQIKHFHQVK